MAVEFNLRNSSTSICPSSQMSSIPPKERAQKIFWGLGDRFWMQIIDGKYHHYGPMVFDQALHKGDKEPGFFSSLKEGCEFASEHLTEKLSIGFYRDLHKKLCSHFKGFENCTRCTAEKAGTFRTDISFVGFGIRKFSEEVEEHYSIVQHYEISDILEVIKTNLPERYLKVCDSYENSKSWIKAWEDSWQKKALEIDDYISKISEKLGVAKFAHVYKQDTAIKILYACHSPQQHEQIIEALISAYNQKKDEIDAHLKITVVEEQVKQLTSEKIGIIAELYQYLEWLHPYIDGQGRTDLVLLAKLLSEEGSNPAILNEPFFSSWSPFSEWKEYLLKGVELWKKERAR